jgi:hypothetical protein
MIAGQTEQLCLFERGQRVHRVVKGEPGAAGNASQHFTGSQKAPLPQRSVGPE